MMGRSPPDAERPATDPLEMIRDLELTNYRSFESYELVDLAPVNLLVGKNNSGKTSILEAIHFLASGGDPYVLQQVTSRRGEVNVHRSPSNGRRRAPDVSHLFCEHRFVPGSEIVITSNGGRNAVRMAVEDDKDSHPLQQSLFGGEMEGVKLLAVRITGTSIEKSIILPATDNGSIHLDSPAARNPGLDALPSSLVRFVTAASLNVLNMRRTWDAVVREGREAEVVDAMKFIEHDLTSIHFLSTGLSLGDVVLGFQPGTRRVPIGSHGEGTRRLLALALSLAQLSGGILLIDEIDTGLHWTVLEDMWKLVIDGATRTGIQVFATTHSFDCIRSLATLAVSRPELARRVSVQKIERALGRAVGFDTADVQRAVDNDIELR